MWAQQHQHKLSKSKSGPGLNLNAGTMARYGIDEIERIV